MFSRPTYAQYVKKLQLDIAQAEAMANDIGGVFERSVDSVYLGGGTPTVLAPEDIRGIFRSLRSTFQIIPDAEVTVECAPGTLSTGMLGALVECGVNRVSLGVQSFVDEEARAVGRLHTRAAALDDITRLRAAGIRNINVDLIAGLPHQTAESWGYSLREAIASGVPHVSVYMLEIDDDSRLGRELIAGGTRYHAHFVPDEDLTADLYSQAVEELNAAGIQQYEISNFARTAFQSRHNLKYWTRQSYLGFGVDAHSMLEAGTGPAESHRAAEFTNSEQGGSRAAGAGSYTITEREIQAIRASAPDSLEAYVAGTALACTPVSARAALEEELFLGLRLNRGVDMNDLANRYSIPPTIHGAVNEQIAWGLLECKGTVVCLTPRGRLLSNEVFQRFIETPEF